MKEEVFLREVKKTKRRWKIDFRLNLEDQRWIYYLLFASFVIIVLLNYSYPNTMENQTYQIKAGFLGMLLTTVGFIFLLSALIFAPYGFLNGIIIVVIAIFLLYFGLPLLLQ